MSSNPFPAVMPPPPLAAARLWLPGQSSSTSRNARLRSWPPRRHPPSTALWSLQLLLVAFVQLSAAQDPVRDFCRRFGHQTAVIDRKLYIDGGLLNYNPISQYPSNFTNSDLLYQDLDVISSDGMPQLYTNLTKNSTIPDVSGGILWADEVNKRFYLFGGEYYQQPPRPTFTLFSFDTLYGQWDSFGIPSQTSIESVSYGAGVSISERGEGYYYGGWMSNNSIQGWSGAPAATSGMVKYLMDSNTWTNSSGPDNIRRAEGSMVYIPASDSGMLVYFGGVQAQANGTTIGQPMETIFLYDVLSSKWYTQNATGDVPDMRRRFCAGAAWAPDRSSYNIYTYGGAGIAPNTTGFDDVYILTIPSFQWIKLWPTDANATANPHNSLTCNVISNSQMLIIGGTFPLSDTCDAPGQWGTHNLDLGEQKAKQQPWQLFQPNLTTYAVPDPIISVVGGSAGGGATKTAPAGGYSNADLPVLMTRTATVAVVRTPTRAITTGTSKSGPVLSTGAIAGIAVGGGVALILALVGCFCLVRRHRSRRFQQQQQQQRPHLGPMGAVLGSDAGSSPWSPHSTTYASSSPFPVGSPFQRPDGPLPGSPVELPGSTSPGIGTTLWHGPDGVTYELQSPGHEGSTWGGTTHSGGTAPSPKVDSDGRIWVPRTASLSHGRTVSRGNDSPIAISEAPGHHLRFPGSGSIGGYSPVAPGSPPGRAAGPSELSPDPRSDNEARRTTAEDGWDAAHGRSTTHQTYYHP